MARLIYGALVLAALLSPGNGRAQPYGDADEGHRIAAMWCSGCHSIGAETKNLANDAVPSFRAVAEMPSTTSLSIQAFLSTPHAVMPDLRLTDAQIDDIGTYILSLRARAPK